MSKSQMAKDLSREQSESGRQSIRTHAEAEQAILEAVDTLIESLSTTAEENQRLIESMADQVKSTDENRKQAIRAYKRVLSKSRSEIDQATDRIQAVAKRIKLATVFATFSAGLIAGVSLLLALLILQPQALEAIQRVSQALAAV